MAQIQLPDGTIIPDFPDNPTAQDIENLRQIGAKAEASAGLSLPDTLKEAGKVAASSVYEGITGLPKLGQAGADWVADKLYGLATSPEHAAKNRAALDKQREEGLVGQFERAIKPKTEMGQRAANVGSSTVGSVLYGGVGGASLGMNAATGLLGGLGSEVAGKLSNPNGPVEQDEPLAKLGGGLTAGLGGGFVYQLGKGLLSSTPYKQKVAKVLMENLDSSDIDRAIRRMEQSAKQGVEITAPQAFSKTTNIDRLAEMASKPEMVNTRRVLNQQVDQMVAKAEDEIAKLPGYASQPTDLANRSREQATNFLDSFGKRAGEVGKGYLPEQDVIPMSVMRGANADLSRLAAANPNAPITQEIVDAAKSAIRNPDWKKELKRRQIATALAHETGDLAPDFGPMPSKYLTNPAQLDIAMRESLAGTGKNALNTAEDTAIRNSRAQEVRNMLKKRLSGEQAPDGTYPNSFQPELDAKKAAQKALLDERDALLQEPIGKLANVTGSERGAGETQSILDIFKNPRYFPRNTRPGRGQVAELQQQLAAGAGEEGSTLFQDGVKTFFKDVVEANKAGQGTRNNPDFMKGLLDGLGNPTRGVGDPRWRQTKDILIANAIDMGETPEAAQQAAKGVEKLLVLSARTAQRSGNPGVNTGTIMAESSPEALRRIGGINVMSMLRQPALLLQKRHEHAVLQSIDQWVSTPAGLDAMRKLAQAPTYKEMRGIIAQFAQQLEGLHKTQTTNRNSSEVPTNTSNE